MNVILRGILSEDDLMPRRYQNAKLEIRRDVARPFYFVRVTVPKITQEGRRRKREVRILGYVDEVSIKEARKLRAAVLEVVNAGRVLVQSQMHFKQVAQRFLDIRVPQLGFATQNKYRTQIVRHILPAFGELRMCDDDSAAVEGWLAAKERAGLGWWSRIDLKGVLSAIFTAAKSWKLWEGDNPTEGVRIGRKRLVREKRLLTVEELRILLAALPERPKFIVLIMFGLGLRISEVLGLRWSDIDWEAKRLSISRRWYRGDLSEEGETKSEASAAPLGLGRSMLHELRSRYPGPHRRGEFLFVGDDGHTPPDDRDLLREEFRPVLRRLKLYYPGFGWHAFRRQNITWRQQVGGATPLEAQRAARHSSLDMTYLYTLSDAERETAQQQAMFDKLMEMPEGPKQ
ncbi:MAG TPA: site-specific integrase [Candidatus Nitrosotalea sp.]|nr:site-specific integrase [Candidatus Nitrosotalea sp.]